MSENSINTPESGRQVNSKRKLRRNAVRLGLYYAVFLLVFFILNLLYDNIRPLQLFRIGSVALSDFEFNDLYYRVAADDPVNYAEKNVILVNAGNFSNDEFRLKLAELITKLETYQPACMGVDFFFKDPYKPGSEELQAALSAAGSVYVGDSTDVFFLPGHKLASLELPGNKSQSMRFYFGSRPLPTLAERLAACYDNTSYLKGLPDSFPLHYTCIHDGFYPMLSGDTTESKINFPALEATEVLSDTAGILQQDIEGRIVIIGWLGRGIMKSNDMEDHFKTPTDTNHLIGRIPLMPGAVIHATAVENLLGDRSEIFTEVPPWLRTFIHHAMLLTFLAFVLFRQPPKWLKISVLGLLSIPYILVILKLMAFRIYFPFGSTLLGLLIIEESIGYIKKPLETLWLKIEKHL